MARRGHCGSTRGQRREVDSGGSTTVTVQARYGPGPSLDDDDGDVCSRITTINIVDLASRLFSSIQIKTYGAEHADRCMSPQAWKPGVVTFSHDTAVILRTPKVTKHFGLLKYSSD